MRKALSPGYWLLDVFFSSRGRISAAQFYARLVVIAVGAFLVLEGSLAVLPFYVALLVALPLAVLCCVGAGSLLDRRLHDLGAEDHQGWMMAHRKLYPQGRHLLWEVFRSNDPLPNHHGLRPRGLFGTTPERER